nr:imidazole glycerol phosphate synthase subunit HisH [Prochlorococcus marinus]
MSKKISILNLTSGNVGSVKRMIEKVGGDPTLIETLSDLKKANKIVLPGVGRFDNAMNIIKEKGFKETLISKLKDDNVISLGICLGMQLLCNYSEEGNVEGLGLINATVKKIDSEKGKYKIPHIGWNTIDILKKNKIIEGSSEEIRFYFVHSYCVHPNEKNLMIASTKYGRSFCSAFRKKNIYGVQFHPEKSHKFGMNLIRNFVNLK